MKNYNNVFCNYVLSIGKFLLNYYNIEGEQLNRLSHLQIKRIFGLVSCPDDIVNIATVKTGRVILVKDGSGEVLAYNNPLFNISDDNYNMIFDSNSILNIEIDNPDKKGDINYQELINLSDYELKELIKYCKKNDDDRTKNMVIKELVKRTGEVKEYKVKKRNIERNDYL